MNSPTKGNYNDSNESDVDQGEIPTLLERYPQLAKEQVSNKELIEKIKQLLEQV